MSTVSIPISGGSTRFVYGYTPNLPDLPIDPVVPGVTFINLDAIQVVGLIPLTPCDETECRIFKDICCDENIVFGNTGDNVPTYENDFSTFLVDYSVYAANLAFATITFKLQKWFEGQWQDSPFGLNLNNNANGIFYGIGTISGHPTYAGYAINWGKIIQNVGAGCYRFVANSLFVTGTDLNGDCIVDEVTNYTSCLASPPFILKSWDCNLAKGTVKFENWLTGEIGEKRKDYVIYNLCGITWYDSVRIKGWFGYYKVPEYKEILLEWGKPKHGKIERVRDEAIQRFEYLSNYLFFYLHERFSVYGMMADELRVSDYNLNNSDYNINRMVIVKDGAYEPEYIDNKGRRRSKVKVLFKRGVQGVIKSICCETASVST